MKKKPLEPKCKNCRLFDSKSNRCAVVILYEGERYNLPVEAEDDCFFENEFVAINEQGEKEIFKPEVQQARFWVEDQKTGNPTQGDGIVKIEYPEGFFNE